MGARSFRRVIRGMLLCAVACAPCAVLASPILVSSVVSLDDPVYGNAGPDLVTVGPLPSIQYGDATNIGQTVLLPGEYIDVGPTSLIYHVEGGVGAPDCPTAGYSCTGYGAGASYNFTDLVFSDPHAFIEGVSVILTDATGISLGDGVSFTADSVSMGVGFGQLGIVSNNNGSQDFGTIEIDLTLGDHVVNPVPEPATGGMFAIGLLYVLGRVRRRR